MKVSIVNILTRLLINLTIKLDRESRNELKKFPMEGPGMLIINHVSIIEGPVLYSFLRPRKTIALGKAELWDKWVTRAAMEAWECIPITRGGVDQNAIKACMGVLDRKDFLCIAPEGTRSKSGIMKKAKPGITLFAKPGIPIIPIAIWGLENYDKNLKRLRRTPMHIRVGEAFIPQRPEGRFSSEKRQEMVDGMMVKIAELMPERYRGYYADKVPEKQ